MTDLSGLNFNADAEEPFRDFSALPAGEYMCVITDSPVKTTKAGTGQYLELKLQVIEGEYKDRNLWVRLNIINPNPVAVQIARSELGAICKAVGIVQLVNSGQLHGIPLMVKVSIREYEGKPQNECKGYAAITQAPAYTPPVSQPVAPAPAVVSAAAPVAAPPVTPPAAPGWINP